MASKESLLADVLTFLKTQQRAEEITRAALRRAGERYLDGEPMKAFKERVDLIARIERLPDETTEKLSPMVERILRDLITLEKTRRENGPALMSLGNIAQRAERVLGPSPGKEKPRS